MQVSKDAALVFALDLVRAIVVQGADHSERYSRNPPQVYPSRKPFPPGNISKEAIPPGISTPGSPPQVYAAGFAYLLLGEALGPQVVAAVVEAE